MTTRTERDAMYAWHDTPTPETLTHLVTVLEGSADPLQVRADTQAHYTGPGHDPNGNEYEEHRCIMCPDPPIVDADGSFMCQEHFEQYLESL